MLRKVYQDRIARDGHGKTGYAGYRSRLPRMSPTIACCGTGERALKIARKHGERGHEAWALRLMARIAAEPAEKQPDAAAELFRQAAQTAEALAMRPLPAHCRLGLGNRLARMGLSSDADAELRAAAEFYRAMDMAFWLPQADAST